MGSAPLEGPAGDPGSGVGKMNQNSPLKQPGSESHGYREATIVAGEAWERTWHRRVNHSGQRVSCHFTPGILLTIHLPSIPLSRFGSKYNCLQKAQHPPLVKSPNVNKEVQCV